jgi:hypothetical protein
MPLQTFADTTSDMLIKAFRYVPSFFPSSLLELRRFLQGGYLLMYMALSAAVQVVVEVIMQLWLVSLRVNPNGKAVIANQWQSMRKVVTLKRIFFHWDSPDYSWRMFP